MELDAPENAATTAAPAATTYSPGLDLVRGVAVGMVVLHHAEVPGFVGGGTAGVTLFFVLSAYLITKRSTRVDRSSLWRFYAARLRRIYPAMMVLVVVLVAYGYGRGRGDEYFERSAAAMSGLLNWFVRPDESLFQLAHLWTIAVELQFYLVWGFLLLVMFGRRRRVVLAVALAVSVGAVALRIAQFDAWGWQRVYVGTDTRADALGLGAAAAVVAGSLQRAFRKRLIAALGVVGCAQVAWLTVTGDKTARLTLTLGLAAGAIGSALVILALEQWQVSGALGPVVGLGRISYGVYLWHYPIVRTLLDDDPVSHWLWVLALVAASIMAGYLSYVLVERRFWRPPTPALAAGL
jgi:peptidoglycan/LPS O-acetylase OafA/YrhL